ncbi:MAG: MMPL family transporter [Acidimicrobiia bacterium]|jgi:RND superfamily putative drug exporter|nr:MMPL family transporter [Acidimicrobiia bacterium]
MLTRLAHLTVRRRRAAVVLALVFFAVAGALGGGVPDRLTSGGFEDPAAESSRVEDALTENFGGGSPNIVLLVTAPDGASVDDPAVAEAGRAVVAELAAETVEGEPVVQVADYWSLPPGNPLRSDDGDRALVLARLPGSEDAIADAIAGITSRYTRDDGPVEVAVGGQAEVFRAVGETIEGDLVRAELIAVPITVVLLVVVFGSVVAAALPLLIGALSVVGTFLVLYGVTAFTDVSIYALNLTTALGLGLAIDYSLFVISRFREELQGGHEPHVAAVRTVRTAGRTVAFSALTVAAALSALLVFDIVFLRSFAWAGLAVAGLAGVFAVVVLPALLAVLGHRIDSLTVFRRSTTTPAEGFWYRMARRVMRRPVPITAAVLVLLLAVGSPVLGLRLGLPDDRVLPASNESRTVQDVIRSEFSSAEAGAVSVVATDLPAAAADRAAAVDTYAVTLATLDGVARVDAETGIYCGTAGGVGELDCQPGQRLVDGSTDASLGERLARDGATNVSVVPSVEPLSLEGEALVDAIRSTEAPFELLVGGQSAQLVDSKASLSGDLPLALAIIAVITFVLLFLMFGSVLLPLKALALNVLSLSATFGVMVWVFQDGNLSGFLGFTATGSIVTTMPVLMFCIAFGLSMDYEVFLLSRIAEEHRAGADDATAVAVGLQRTGRIVTAAAVLISVVFLAFATSGVSFIKLFGIGLTLAVLLDAFVIRGTLVPAFMRLAGGANWWAPGPLRRFHDRFGLSEHAELDGAPPPAGGEPLLRPVPGDIVAPGGPDAVAHDGRAKVTM